MKFLEVEDEKDEQLCNQYQHVEKLAVCDEGLNHKEEDEGSPMNVSSHFSNSEILGQEGLCQLDSFEKQNDNYFETSENNEVVESEILNEVVDISFENCHENSLQDLK